MCQPKLVCLLGVGQNLCVCWVQVCSAGECKCVLCERMCVCVLVFVLFV